MSVSGLNKGIDKVEVALRWDPSPMGAPDHDLDIIAATYAAGEPYGEPAYLVHFDSRSPDGTIHLNRDSRDGLGLGFDEVMNLELGRLSTEYGRVVIGVIVQQRDMHTTFAEVRNTGFRIRETVAGAEAPTDLVEGDLAEVSSATAATVAEFIRGTTGDWEYHPVLQGFDADTSSFAHLMGRKY